MALYRPCVWTYDQSPRRCRRHAPKLIARAEAGHPGRSGRSRRIALYDNVAEQLLRGVAIGRKNYQFVGSDLGAERTAVFYNLIETAKLNRLNAKAYLRDELMRIADHRAKRLADLLSWNWAPDQPAA